MICVCAWSCFSFEHENVVIVFVWSVCFGLNVLLFCRFCDWSSRLMLSLLILSLGSIFIIPFFFSFFSFLRSFVFLFIVSYSSFFSGCDSSSSRSSSSSSSSSSGSSSGLAIGERLVAITTA